jgi:hypothetical protein
LEEIQLHPNPNRGVFNLEIPVIGRQLTIEILNVSGLLIHSEELQKTETNIIHQINNAGTPPGVYFVRISNSEGIVVKKIVIQ